MSAKHEKFLKFGLAEGCHLLYKESSQLLYCPYNRPSFKNTLVGVSYVGKMREIMLVTLSSISKFLEKPWKIL